MKQKTGSRRVASTDGLTPGLYLVATPLGNLEDVTIRALKILGSCDMIACEDTRVTGRLLDLLGIHPPPMISYHDHNARQAGVILLEHLQNKAAIALVCDAGTPLLSDPGFALVRDCIAADIPVITLPGPSAFLSALQLSGLPADCFHFAGFLPTRTIGRQQVLLQLLAIDATLIFYESPRRLPASLADMAKILGARNASVSREITKLFEETRRGTLVSLAEHYAREGAPKGEIVIVVDRDRSENNIDPDQLLEQFLKEMSLRDAVARVQEITGLPRKKIYERALNVEAKSPLPPFFKGGGVG